MHQVPAYLKDYAPLYAENPRAAATEWFRNARYGLFLHYGLYSLLGRHEWVQLREKIHVAEYAKLAHRFTAEKFDAEAIVRFAIDCGMRYVNLTTRHHDSFCLWDTQETSFKSTNTPCGRDLVAELAQACQRHGIGLCLYYSHGRDWRHPHAPNNDRYGGNARPLYDPPEPTYATGPEHDLNLYVDFMTRQVTELLGNYGPIAAIWLDGIAVPINGDTDAFRCQELYDRIHQLQPHTLVSYKQGLLGTEDFFAPEHNVPIGQDAKKAGKMTADDPRPREICTTMCPGSWGYLEAGKGKHRSPENVWEELRNAARGHANLLLNTGPLPDGSLDPEDEPVLRAIGARLRSEGFPA